MQAPNTATQVVTVVLIILMSATTFTTQRQLMTKNMPASALDNPFAKQQKVLLYVLPLVFAVSGVNFPIGVLIYWFTTNVWSMCQQFYVIRRMPAPGSAAEKAYHARLERKGKPIPGADAAKAKARRRGGGGGRAGQAVRASASSRPRRSARRARPPVAKPARRRAGAREGIQDTPKAPGATPGRRPRRRPARRARARHARARPRTTHAAAQEDRQPRTAKPPTT